MNPTDRLYYYKRIDCQDVAWWFDHQATSNNPCLYMINYPI